ncbi:MAG: hypothetical protein MHPSP_001994, partial [Paramarteilia canceri]
NLLKDFIEKPLSEFLHENCSKFSIFVLDDNLHLNCREKDCIDNGIAPKNKSFKFSLKPDSSDYLNTQEETSYSEHFLSYDENFKEVYTLIVQENDRVEDSIQYRSKLV